jgi:hypothetical protein
MEKFILIAIYFMFLGTGNLFSQNNSSKNSNINIFESKTKFDTNTMIEDNTITNNHDKGGNVFIEVISELIINMGNVNIYSKKWLNARIQGLLITKIDSGPIKPLSLNITNPQIIYQNGNIYEDEGQSLNQFLSNYQFSGTYIFTFYLQNSTSVSYIYTIN